MPGRAKLVVRMQGLITRRHFTLLLAGAGVAPLAGRFGACSAAHAAVTPIAPVAPIAPIVPKTFEAFGQERVDNYDWLRNRNDPQSGRLPPCGKRLCRRTARGHQAAGEQTADELKARAAEADVSVPTLDNGYFYERRFANGARYPLIVRRQDAPGAADEVVLDVGALAASALATGISSIGSALGP